MGNVPLDRSTIRLQNSFAPADLMVVLPATWTWLLGASLLLLGKPSVQPWLRFRPRGRKAALGCWLLSFLQMRLDFKRPGASSRLFLMPLSSTSSAEAEAAAAAVAFVLSSRPHLVLCLLFRVEVEIFGEVATKPKCPIHTYLLLRPSTTTIQGTLWPGASCLHEPTRLLRVPGCLRLLLYSTELIHIKCSSYAFICTGRLVWANNIHILQKFRLVFRGPSNQ